jgi:hypothetical protein
MSEIQIIVPIIIALTTSIFGPLLVKWVEKRFISRLNNDPLADAIQHNEIIEQQLDTILQELDCDQVYIAQFHNGGHFYPTGKSIQKFSVFYEITTPETNSLKTAFQNIPVSLFSKQFAILYEKGEIVVEDMTTGPSYGLDLYQSEGPKCKSIYLLTVKGLDGRIIGIMGIHYVGKKHKLSQGEWIFIREKLGAIGNLMANYLTSKKSH